MNDLQQLARAVALLQTGEYTAHELAAAVPTSVAKADRWLALLFAEGLLCSGGRRSVAGKPWTRSRVWRWHR